MAALWTDYEPTERQKKVVNFFRDNDYTNCVAEACKVCKVSRQTYYNWHRDERFSRWWQSELLHHFGLRLGAVLGSVFREATVPRGPGDRRYNVSAARVLLDRFDEGFQPKSRQRIDHRHQIHGAGDDGWQRRCEEALAAVNEPGDDSA